MTLVNALGDLALDTSVGQVKASVDAVNTTLASGIKVGTNKTTIHAYSLVGVIAVNTDLLIIDCSDYASISIQCTSMGTSGIVTPGWSNDGVYYVGGTIAASSGSTVGTISGTGIWRSEVLGKYLRLRLTTATTGGTTSFVVNGKQASVGNSAQAVALSAGSQLAADVSLQYRAGSTGGASGTHIVSAATTNPTIVKASAGKVIGWSLANTTASWKFVKLHNQSTSPTAGAGVVRTIAIPPNGLAQQSLPGGVAFAAGIALTITGASADADTTAVAVGDVVGDLFYA